MTLFTQLQSRLKEAMIARDEFTLSLVRGLLSVLHNKAIELHIVDADLDDEIVLDVLRRETKKRQEAMRLYTEGGRSELAQKEEKEANFIATFLPAQLSSEEVEHIVDEALSDFENPTQKDFGSIMKVVMGKVDGRADGSAVSTIIKQKLS